MGPIRPHGTVFGRNRPPASKIEGFSLRQAPPATALRPDKALCPSLPQRGTMGWGTWGLEWQRLAIYVHRILILVYRVWIMRRCPVRPERLW